MSTLESCWRALSREIGGHNLSQQNSALGPRSAPPSHAHRTECLPARTSPPEIATSHRQHALTMGQSVVPSPTGRRTTSALIGDVDPAEQSRTMCATCNDRTGSGDDAATAIPSPAGGGPPVRSFLPAPAPATETGGSLLLLPCGWSIHDLLALWPAAGTTSSKAPTLRACRRAAGTPTACMQLAIVDTNSTARRERHSRSPRCSTPREPSTLHCTHARILKTILGVDRAEEHDVRESDSRASPFEHLSSPILLSSCWVHAMTFR